MNQPLRVLIVEDIPDDAELMALRLEEEGFNPEWFRVQTEQDYVNALQKSPDIILADWSLPQFSGLRALELMKQLGLDIPFILVSGSIGEEAAIDALHRGASDYILKDRSKRLGQAVQRILESRSYQLQKEQAETELIRRLAELEVLYKISSSLRYLESVDAMLIALLDQVLAVLDIEAGAVWLENQEQTELHLASAQGWFTRLDDIVFQPGEGLVGSTYQLYQPYRCREFINDPNISQTALTIIPSGTGGALVPIHGNEANIGVMAISVPLPRLINDHELKLLSSIAELAGIAVHRIRLFEELKKAETTLTKAYDQTIKGWSDALELRDQETEGHCERVSELTMSLAENMGIGKDNMVHVYRGSVLHDIGKMGISDTILLKPAPLTEQEWEIMRQHPQYAYDILAPISYLRPALHIPYCHHEKYDGTGYPRGLKGEEIPLEARIFAVVDVFDALTSDRPYRKAWTRKKSLDYLRSESGKHFDSKVVKLFLELIKGVK